VDAVPVRTRARAEELASGRRSGGSTAVSVGGEADKRVPLVSVSPRAGKGQRAQAAREGARGLAWAESKQAARMHSALFFFLCILIC